MSTGFNFGATPAAQQTTAAKGFSFGTPQTQQTNASFNFGGGSMAPAAGAGTPGSAGFNFGTASPAPAGSTPFGAQNTGGLNLGIAKPQQSVQANNSLGLNLSTKGAATGTPSTGFTLGGVSAQPTTGFTLGGGSAAKPATGFGLGGTTAPATGFGLGGVTAAAPSTGFGLGGVTAAAPSTGLTLGGATAKPATGFTLGGATTAAPATGFSLGGSTAQTPNKGLTLQGAAANAAAGLNLTGANKTATFSLGGATATTASTGLNLSAAATTSASAGLTLGGGTAGFSLGGVKTTAPTTGLTLGGTTAAPSTGLTLGGAPTLGLGGSAASGGLTLGGAAKTTSSGFSLGGTGISGSAFSLGGSTTSSAGSTLFSGLGLTSSTSSGLTLGTTQPLTLGGLGGASSTSTGLTLGGAATSSTGGIFGTSTTTASVSKGLGGVDPKTTTSSTGSTSTVGKATDTKAIKETNLPNEITTTVNTFKEYVKKERSVREDIARMSSKPLYKVQEEVVTLKQLLSVVSNGLQRNAVTIEKLKRESAQELKSAEIAQRTKDTPPSLQYENTAPTEYFQRLVSDFEMQMQLYRQQIDEMESHLASLNQPSSLTPQELSVLLRKLHETFIALAAQLQVVHEGVKHQKEHYLNYRKVFYRDTTDVFNHSRKVAEKSQRPSVQVTVGPTPFTGVSNVAAMAMASAMNRAQQPAAGAPPTLGLNTAAVPGSTGFGSALGTSGGGLGTSQFGSMTYKPLGTGTGLSSTPFQAAGTGFGLSAPLGTTTGAGGLGSTPGGTLFGSTPNTGTTGGLFAGAANTSFGTPTPSTSFNLGTSTPALGGSNPALGASPALGTSFGGFQANAFGVQNKTFQLQKPPVGNKRGKKA